MGDLLLRQGHEPDAKKREALVHDIQKTIREKATAIPLFEQAVISRNDEGRRSRRRAAVMEGAR